MTDTTPHLDVEGTVARISLRAPQRNDALSIDDITQLAAGAPIAVNGMKAACGAYATGGGAADAAAREGFLASLRSMHQPEGLRAMMDGRDPVFTGTTTGGNADATTEAQMSRWVIPGRAGASGPVVVA